MNIIFIVYFFLVIGIIIGALLCSNEEESLLICLFLFIFSFVFLFIFSFQNEIMYAQNKVRLFFKPYHVILDLILIILLIISVSIPALLSIVPLRILIGYVIDYVKNKNKEV